MIRNRLYRPILPARVHVESILQQNFESKLTINDMISVTDPKEGNRICTELACNTLSLHSSGYFKSVEARVPALKSTFVRERWDALRVAQEENMSPLFVLKNMMDHFNTDIAARGYGVSDSDVNAREIGGWLVGGKVYSSAFKADVYVVCGLIICPQIGVVDHHDDVLATPFTNWIADRQKNLACLGWIHTHPNKTSEPSTADLSMYYNRLIGPQVSRVFQPEALMVVCQRKTNKTHVAIASYRLSPFGLHVIGHQMQFYEELKQVIVQHPHATKEAQRLFKGLMFQCSECHRPYWPVMGDEGTHEDPVLKSNTPSMYYRVAGSSQLTPNNRVVMNSNVYTRQLGDQVAREYNLGVPFFILDYGDMQDTDGMDYKIWVQKQGSAKFEETSLREFQKLMEDSRKEPNWKLWTPADW